MKKGTEKISKFEDLIAWQKARELTKEIYSASKNGDFGKDFGLRDQIRRASVSVMSNIAEGFDRGGRPEFHQYLVVAKASCAEVRSQLYVALDAGYLSDELFDRLFCMADEVSRIVNGLRSAVKKQRDKDRTES
ncbi:MAG: four helix bundle protein [bacterium]|nr:four helix bundle protein [bacterium]